MILNDNYTTNMYIQVFNYCLNYSNSFALQLFSKMMSHIDLMCFSHTLLKVRKTKQKLIFSINTECYTVIKHSKISFQIRALFYVKN